MVYKKGRSCKHHSLNMLPAGLDRLVSGALDKFNTQFKPLDEKDLSMKTKRTTIPTPDFPQIQPC